MKEINQKRNTILRLKRIFKETFIFPFLNLFEKINENKKLRNTIVLSIMGIIFIVSVFFGVKNLYSYIHKLDGPNVSNITLSNSEYGKVVYSGSMNKGKVTGNGTLTITGDKWTVEVSGTFNDKISENKNSRVNFGEFEKGTIKMNSTDGNSYSWSGDFKDNQLIKGAINKTIDENFVSYNGNFKDGKLNGSGTKTVQKKDEKRQTISGWFENGTLVK